MREGWEMKKLGEVSKIMYGYTAKASLAIEGVSYLRITDIQNSSVNWLTVPNCPISNSDYNKYQLKSGDIVFARTGATTGKSFLLKNPSNAVFASYLIRVQITSSELSPEFLYIFFQSPSYWNLIKSGITGSAQGGFNAKKLSELIIPIPSLPEQKQIVALLDKAFATINQAKANLEKNIDNAKELFQSKLNEIFSQKGDGWEEKTLGEVCNLYQGLAINKKTKHLLVEKSSLPLLRIKDLRKNTHEQYVSEIGYPVNSLVTEDEIIYTRTGNSLGLVFRGRKGILHNNSFKIKPINLLSNDYLFWWLQHDAFHKKITILASKAAQPDISHKIFKVQPITIPSKELQAKYYIQIQKLNESTNQLLSRYREKLISLEELKKSILEKAFAGELTPKDLVS
jgi:type I restriction enzyme S subunit